MTWFLFLWPPLFKAASADVGELSIACWCFLSRRYPDEDAVVRSLSDAVFGGAGHRTSNDLTSAVGRCDMKNDMYMHITEPGQ